jgi:hypothetical protein
MTIGHAVMKLQRSGWQVTHTSRHYLARKSGLNSEISFLPNGVDEPTNEAVCLRVRSLNDTDDMQSDYTAGSFYDSMTQAIHAAER